MTEQIDDYVCDIEIPLLDDRVHGFDDDDFDLSPGSPKSPKQDALVGFLLPALTPSRIRDEGSGQSSEEKGDVFADSNHRSDCRRRQVPSPDEAYPGPAGTTKTITGVKESLPALNFPRPTLGLDDSHAASSKEKASGNEDSNAPISKYNSLTQYEATESSSGEEDLTAPVLSKYNCLTQYEIDLKESDWIQVTVRDYKTGKEVMSRLITPDLCIQDVREELHFIGGIIDSPNSSSILRLADKHTIWKTNGNGSGGNTSKKNHTVKQGGPKLGPDGFWGRRKGHNKQDSESGEQQSRCLPAISDEATLAETYLETKPPKAIGSLHGKQTSSESNAGEIGTMRHSKSEGSAAGKNVNRLLEMRRSRSAAVIKKDSGSAPGSLKSNHGAHTRITGPDVKVDVATVEKERRTLFLLWEHTTTDDDYENALLFVQRVCPEAASSSSTDYYPAKAATTDNSTSAASTAASCSSTDNSSFVDSPQSCSVHALGTPVEPMEPFCEPPLVLEPVVEPVVEPMEPDCGPPPAISKYVRVRNVLPKPRRSFSEVAKRCSLPKLAAEDMKDTKGRGGGGGDEPSLSSSGEKTAMVLNGMATWRPSDARALSMAKLSNEKEASRDLLAENMSQWEGLSLMDGRVTRLHLCECLPSLQGSAILGPEIGRMSELQRINLSKNKLSGPLPLLKCLGRLANLRQLSISNNQISGSLKNISVLKHLADLDLSRNAITGSIPEELGSLRGLMSLNLSHNKLAGTIPPEMSELFKLCVLNLSNNFLFGHIDNWIGSLKNLQRIDLGHNQLEGSLPTALHRLPSLEYLHLHDNQFRGDFPIEMLINLNPGIREMTLQSNAFHSLGGSNPGTHKKEEKKQPVLLKEEIEDASQIAAKAVALLVDYKKILVDTYNQCSIEI